MTTLTVAKKPKLLTRGQSLLSRPRKSTLEALPGRCNCIRDGEIPGFSRRGRGRIRNSGESGDGLPLSRSRDRTDARGDRGPDTAHDVPHHAVTPVPQEAKRIGDARSGALQQLAADEGPGAVEPYLDRRTRELERAGHFGRRDTVHVAQHEDEPVLLRESVDRLLDEPADLAIARRSLRVVRWTLR